MLDVLLPQVPFLCMCALMIVRERAHSRQVALLIEDARRPRMPATQAVLRDMYRDAMGEKPSEPDPLTWTRSAKDEWKIDQRRKGNPGT